MNDSILLTESVGDYINFSLHAGENYIVKKSLTITLNPKDLYHELIKSEIEKIDPILIKNVDHLSIVMLIPGTTTVTPINGLFCELEATGPNHPLPNANGLVVTIEYGSQMKLIHKPKRTMGRVSNSLG